MRSIIYSYSPEELQKLLDESNGYSDVLRKIGICTKGGNPETLKKVISEYGLSTDKLCENRSKLYSECAISTHTKTRCNLQDVFDGKRKSYSSSYLLKRLVKEGYKKYICEECGISEWNGKKLSLQLDHINGNHNDNRLENLRILCPNCHSQTDTFSGKSSRKNLNKCNLMKKK